MASETEYTLSEEELRSLQLILLEMLLEVDRVCKINSIRYCIFAGTMLGAVRHGGFIPWDDDLDVAMVRSEYVKFQQACKKDLDTNRFFFQDHSTDPHYRWGYARILYKDTGFVRVGQEHMKMKTGIFLDVFPLDGVPSLAPFRALHSFYCFIIRKLLYAEAGRKTGSSLILRLCYSLLNFIPRAWTVRRIEKLALTRRTSKLVRIITFPTPKGRAFGFSREWFEDLADISFEGHLFPGNLNYDDFLTYYYDDYMQLPPPEKRWWHPVSKFRLPADLSAKGD